MGGVGMKKILPFLMVGLFGFAQAIAAQTTTIPTIPTESTTHAVPSTAVPSTAVPSTAAPATETNPDLSDVNELTPEQRNAIREKILDQWNKLTPEEKEEVHRKIQEKWESMTPEEKEVVKERMRKHFRSLSPKEKEEFLKRRRGELPMNSAEPAPTEIPVVEPAPATTVPVMPQ